MFITGIASYFGKEIQEEIEFHKEKYEYIFDSGCTMTVPTMKSMVSTVNLAYTSLDRADNHETSYLL